MNKEHKKRLTIIDVAREAGVSTATVSNVLKGKAGNYTEATAAQVHQTVKNLGYVKNVTASSLSGRKSHMIAVIIIGVYEPQEGQPDPEINPFYGEFIFRLDHEARKRGYAVCIYSGAEANYVEFLLERNIDAAVLVGVMETDLPARLEGQDIRVILFDSLVDTRKAMVVRTDEERGGELAAAHLIQPGRKKLAFLGDLSAGRPNSVPACRLRGARHACDQAGIPLREVPCWTSYSSGRDAAADILSAGIDGVVTAADVIAAGLVDGLQQRGAGVPAGVAVVGYDNLPISRMCTPELTTIDQGLNDKVRAVIELAVDGGVGERRVVEPRLIVRAST